MLNELSSVFKARITLRPSSEVICERGVPIENGGIYYNSLIETFISYFDKKLIRDNDKMGYECASSGFMVIILFNNTRVSCSKNV